jgi:plasmid stability protein
MARVVVMRAISITNPRDANMNALTLLTHDDITTLDDLVASFETAESLSNPDVVVPLDKIRMTGDGMLHVPNLHGELALNDWSRSQLARLAGVSWDRWFEGTDARERAEEMNRRLARASGTVRVRSTRRIVKDVQADGVIRALVSPDYSPIADALVVRVLGDALRGVEDQARVVRYSATDLSTVFAVRIGERLTPSAEVGAVEGCVYVRNSGVGFARLVVGLMLHRLACKNGMIVSLPGATLVRAVHLHVDPFRIAQRIAEGLRDLPDKIHRGARVMAASAAYDVANVELEVRDVLREAKLPMRLVQPVMSAYAREPSPTRFGVSQAITLAAQALTPEQRFDLERAAGIYLAEAR